jgi:TolB protein
MILVGMLTACGGLVEPPAPSPMPGAPQSLPLSGPIAEAPGKILFDRPGAWWTFEPSTQETQEITTFPSQIFPSTAAVSPDGQTVAFSVFTYGKGPDDPAYGTDLYLMKPDGTEQRKLLVHAVPGETLTEPAWSSDGSTIFFTQRNPTGEYRIERVRLDGSDRTVVVEQAQSPTLSADGQHLVYMSLSDPAQMMKLMVARPDGSNPQPLLANQTFQILAAPRFAPTGNQLVFSAVPERAPTPSQSSSESFDPLGWLRPRVAQAHGVPWDLWVVNADGSGLRQLTDLEEDYPVATWSPDGAWIGFKGEMGMYIVDAAGKQVRRVSEDTAASVAWLR